MEAVELLFYPKFPNALAFGKADRPPPLVRRARAALERTKMNAKQRIGGISRG